MMGRVPDDAAARLIGEFVWQELTTYDDVDLVDALDDGRAITQMLHENGYAIVRDRG